jgi:hypothetical protein
MQRLAERNLKPLVQRTGWRMVDDMGPQTQPKMRMTTRLARPTRRTSMEQPTRKKSFPSRLGHGSRKAMPASTLLALVEHPETLKLG